MALFPKKGERNVTEPLSDIYFRDAEKFALERTTAEAQCNANDAEIDSLALAAESGDVDALARIATLEAESAALHKLVRRKLHAERQRKAMGENERKSEQWARDKKNRAKQARKSGARLDPAKRIPKLTVALLSEIRLLQQPTEEIHIAWSEAWPFKGPAGTYPARLNEWIAHELHVQAKALNMKWPTAAYSQSDWPGLAAKIKAADAWTKATLLDGETPIEDMIEPELPAIASAADELLGPAAPPAPLTDAELHANELHDNPLKLPLSGRVWQALQDQNKTPVAVEYSPFTGGEEI